MNNLVIYLVGVVIVVGALAYGAFRLGIDPVWIGVGAAVVLGLGIMGGVSKTQKRD